MVVATGESQLPFGMGRVGKAWVTIAVVLLMIIGLGAYAYSRQIFEGESATGLGDLGTRGGAPWGLYIAFELWIVGAGFGAMILIGAAHLLGIEPIMRFTRALGVLALAGIFVGGWSIIADVGQPLRAIVNILRYARPMSPFFGTFTIGVVLAFAVLIVFLFLDSRPDAAKLAKTKTRWNGLLRLAAAGYTDTPAERKRRQQVSRALGAVLIIVGVVAASTSGFVFGVQQGRPGWVSALQAPGSVVLAGVAGTALAVLIATVVRSSLAEGKRIDGRSFAWLNGLLLAFTGVATYFVLVEVISSGYVARQDAKAVTDAIITGRYAWLFWLSNGLFMVTVVGTAWQLARRRYNTGFTVGLAVLAGFAALGKRYLLVVPPLTHGRLLPYSEGSYTPNWVEYLVVIGLVAVAIGFFMVFMKLFPILALEQPTNAADGDAV